MAKSSRRVEQVNEFLRQEVSLLIQQERDALRLDLVSVTEVQVSPDLRHAKVYVSTLGSEAKREYAVAVLRRHATHLRHLLAPRITFRSVPTLDFRSDSSLEKGAEVLRALNEVERMRQANPPRLDDDAPASAPAPEPEAAPAPKPNPRARKRRTED